MGLTIELSFARESTNQAFAAQKGTDPALSGFGDLEAQSLLKGHNMPCIYDEVPVHIHGIDGSEGVH